jgi:hypothetical protein
MGQGILQGSSSAGPIFLLNSDVSLSPYQKNGKAAAFCHPITHNIIEDKSVQFVDDTSQFLNAKGAGIDPENSPEPIGQQLLPFAIKNSQAWADFLWISGGDKCYLYAFIPKMNYKTNQITCEEMPLTTPMASKNQTLHRIKHVHTSLSTSLVP